MSGSATSTTIPRTCGARAEQRTRRRTQRPDQTVEIRARPLDLGRAVRALLGAGTLGRRDIEAIDQIVAYTAVGVTELSELDGADRWRCRQATMELLRNAPGLDQDLRAWIRGAATALGEVVAPLVDSPAHTPGQVLTSQAAQEGNIAGEVLVPWYVSSAPRHCTTSRARAAERYWSSSIGCDRSSGARKARLWSRPLLGETVAEEDAEELRIAFVALTRARRYCALGLPNNCGDDVLAAFEGAGFVVA